jgi:hypothetical protein
MESNTHMNALIHITADVPLLDEVLEEAARLRPSWNALSEAIPQWHPRNEGDDDDDTDNDNDDGDDDSSKKKKGSADPDGDDDDSDSTDSDDDDDDQVVKVPKAEHDAMRRELAQRRRQEKQEKDRKKQQDTRKRADAGRYQEIIDEKDLEIEEKDKEIAALKGELVKTKSKTLISRIAKRLNFEDLEDAEVWYDRYEKDGEDRTKESDVEAVLKRILRAKPKLKARSNATGGPTGGSSGNGKLTFEDIQQMSRDEISKRYNDPEFQAALVAGPTK